jgi:hypothetical protein
MENEKLKVGILYLFIFFFGGGNDFYLLPALTLTMYRSGCGCLGSLNLDLPHMLCYFQLEKRLISDPDPNM